MGHTFTVTLQFFYKRARTALSLNPYRAHTMVSANEAAKKDKKTTIKVIFCNILEYEIPLSRCKPVREYKKCKACEGYVLKQKSKKKSKERKVS